MEQKNCDSWLSIGYLTFQFYFCKKNDNDKEIFSIVFLFFLFDDTKCGK